MTRDADAPPDEPTKSPEPAESPEPAKSPEPTPRVGRAIHEIVHDWIPLGIVIVSVLAALLGWRASVSDESAAHAEELSRQDLVQQQQLLVQNNHAVDSDVDTFGQFAQYSVLAHSLREDAATVSGGLSAELTAEAQSDLGIARYRAKQITYQNYLFDPTNPSGNPALLSDGTYAPGHPYNAAQALAGAENADAALHGLAPEKLHQTAETEHRRGVDFEGIAALFVAVMVMLTVAALAKGPPKLWLTASGAAIAIVGAVLFATVQFS